MFLTPLFLIGGLLAATLPILLHLLQKRRQVTIPFPTLRFLKQAERKSSRRLHFENMLLWLLRTLIMLLLGAAFAMPVLRSQGLAWMGRAPRDVAIVIDASYSMGYQTGRDTVWKKAIETATDIINGLDEKDRFCLFLAGDQPHPLIAEPVGDREQGLQVLKAAAIKTTGSRLFPAINAAISALEREQKGRERELYVITDGQAAPWQHSAGIQDIETAPGDTDELKPGKKISQFVVLLGPPAPVNLSPVSLDMNPTLLLHDAPARIRVSARHTGPDRESIVRLFIGEKEIGRRPLRLAAGENAEVEFTIPPQTPGIYPARVETPEDGLDIDNAFHFLVRVQVQRPVLCVGTEEDTLYLRTALRSSMTGDTRIDPERVDVDALAERPLHEIVAIFLCNALPVSGQALAPLEEYVRGGGLLVFFPGERAAPNDYLAWTTLPLEGIAINDLSGLERGRTLSWASGDHPLLRRFPLEGSPPRITVRRLLSGTGLAEDSQVLISQGPDAPFLVERKVGNGRVLMFTVAADRTWSDFPLSPFYLPLLAQVVEYSAGIGGLSPYSWSTHALPLAQVVPGATRETALLGPDGRRLPVSSAVVDGLTQMRVENLDQPGIYTAADQGPVLAVNMARGESDLTALKDGEVEELVDADPLYVARDNETLNRLIEEHRLGRTLGEHLLWLVLILVAVEFMYANRLARARPALSEQLSVEASGRVKGHAEVAS